MKKKIPGKWKLHKEEVTLTRASLGQISQVTPRAEHQSCSKWETRWRSVKTFCHYVKWMPRDHFIPAFQPVFRVFSTLLLGKLWVLQLTCRPPHSYIIYIPTFDLSLLLFLYNLFSRNFLVIMDWFFCTLQFSSPFFRWLCFNTSHLVTILPSLLVFLLALELCIAHTTDYAFMIFS